jgi:hypothetical protein
VTALSYYSALSALHDSLGANAPGPSKDLLVKFCPRPYYMILLLATKTGGVIFFFFSFFHREFFRIFLAFTMFNSPPLSCVDNERALIWLFN